MAFRKRARKFHKREFRRTAQRVHRRNVNAAPMRGGIRL